MTGQRGLLWAAILAWLAQMSRLVEAPELAAAERPAHVPVRRTGVSGPVLPEGPAK